MILLIWFAQSIWYFFEDFTKLNPFTSQTYDLFPDLNKSKPHTLYLKACYIFLAISFSSCDRLTGYLISFPLTSLYTTPSKVGHFLASACAYSLPTVYILISNPSVGRNSSYIYEPSFLIVDTPF